MFFAHLLYLSNWLSVCFWVTFPCIPRGKRRGIRDRGGRAVGGHAVHLIGQRGVRQTLLLTLTNETRQRELVVRRQTRRVTEALRPRRAVLLNGTRLEIRMRKESPRESSVTANLLCKGVTSHFVIQVIVAFVQFLQSEIPVIFHVDFEIKLSCGSLHQLKHTNMSHISEHNHTLTSLLETTVLRSGEIRARKLVTSYSEVTHRFLALDDPHSPGHIQRCLSILIG